jgi:DNA-binding transcriptional ArsR family regulator
VSTSTGRTAVPGREDAVFSALADPTRRRLLAAVAAAPATATELAGGLPISRQAVVKHLGALAEAGLLARERTGREVRYRITPQPLSEAVGWMAEVGSDWDERLASLAKAFGPARQADLGYFGENPK